jgi:FkbM family methyltransferase
MDLSCAGRQRPPGDVMALKRTLRLAARRLGLDVRPLDQLREPALRLVRMCEAYGVTIALDVGANVGDWARELRFAGYGGRLVSFEPLARPGIQLAATAAHDPLWTTVRTALGREGGASSLSVSRDARWSSLLPLVAVNEQAKVVGKETVPVQTLDEATRAFVTEDDRALLKLDVEGYELEVLAGATELLPRVAIAQIEVLLRPTYEGQGSREELFSTLEQAGLRLAGVERGHVDTATGDDLTLAIPAFRSHRTSLPW